MEEQFHRQGIGSLLMRHVEDWARKLQVTLAVVGTNVDSPSSIPFYDMMAVLTLRHDGRPHLPQNLTGPALTDAAPSTGSGQTVEPARKRVPNSSP